MSAASNDNEQGSDLDEPMASQSQVSNYGDHDTVYSLKSPHFMPPQNKTVSLVKFKLSMSLHKLQSTCPHFKVSVH